MRMSQADKYGISSSLDSPRTNFRIMIELASLPPFLPSGLPGLWNARRVHHSQVFNSRTRVHGPRSTQFYFHLLYDFSSGLAAAFESSSSFFSFRFCTTSQLYTRAVATSIVYANLLVFCCPVSNAGMKLQLLLAVICSRIKSRSSSQFERLVLAALSLDSSSAWASSMGYESMTLACKGGQRRVRCGATWILVLPQARCKLLLWVECWRASIMCR